MKKLIHKIKHKLGWYYGTVESFHIGDVIYTGFKCSTCGEINHAQMSDFLFRTKSGKPHEKEN